jgi:hypothetical protein
LRNIDSAIANPLLFGMKFIEIPLKEPFDSLPPHNIRSKGESMLVGRKVVFFFEPEAFLNPDGVLGKYRIEFIPEEGDSFYVEPEPDKYYTETQAIERAMKLLTSFNAGLYLEYRLFGEQPISTLGFKA